MAIAKKKENILDGIDMIAIYADLKIRLVKAKSGAGIKFNEIGHDNLINYLDSVGVPKDGLTQAIKFLTEKFKEEFLPTPEITVSKHIPRKSVFGEIVKITK